MWLNFQKKFTDQFLFHFFLSVQLRKMYDTPLVRLQPEGDWSADIDAMVVYSPLQHFRSSTWDWIGLYKVSHTLLHKTSNKMKWNSFQLQFQVGFTTVLDYITYTWVKDDEVAFNEEFFQVSIEVNKK